MVPERSSRMLFHYLVLLQAKDKNPGDVTAVLQSRMKG